MSPLEKLQESREAMVKRLVEIRDKVADDTYCAEDKAKWDEINADLNALDERMRIVEQTQKLEDEKRQAEQDVKELEQRAERGELQIQQRGEMVTMDAPEVRYEDREKMREVALRSWFMSRKRELRAEEREACRSVGVDPFMPEIEFNLYRGPYDHVRMWALEQAYGRIPFHQRFQQVGTPSTPVPNLGVEGVPEQLIRTYEIALLAFGGMRVASTVIRTSGGGPLRWPTTNDTNVGTILPQPVPEGSTIQDFPVATDEVVFGHAKFSSHFIKSSQELIEDDEAGLIGIIPRLAAERVGRITNQFFTDGTGVDQPEGILTGTPATTTTFSATPANQTGDDLIDIVHEIDPAYRMNFAWMMNDTTLSVIRKIKDANDVYLWQPGLTLGVPDRLLSYPIVINQDLPDIAAGTAGCFVVGDHSKFVIRDIASFRFRRLDERFADEDIVAWVALSRHDSRLVDAGTNPLKHVVGAA